MEIVVGAGPSGLAVTHALLARGRRVTMIDGGAALDGAARDRQAALAAIPPDQWSTEQRAAWQAPQFAPNPGGLARRYGSDHAQIPLNETLDSPPDWFALRASHAVGGHSDVWGSAVLPNRPADIADWPFNSADLAPHYKAVAGFMPISGRADRLEALFPDFTIEGRTPLRSGPQGRSLLARLDRIGDTLAAQGVHVGQARQAVGPDCQYCGMCLHGCPWNQIFSARHGLETLKSNPDFTYLPGRIAMRFSQSGDQAEVHLKDGTSLKGDRLYLGAGVLETARIVLASHVGSEQSLTLRDSQHFFLPMLHGWRPDGNPETDPHHTLTEAFVEVDDPAVSPFLTHTQIYGWNEFYAREMIANYGAKLPGSAPLFRALSRRLMVAQTFLHSDHSAQITLRLGVGGERLSATLQHNPDTEAVMTATKDKLARALRSAGLYALKFASRPGAPGSSFHVGGTLPMSQAPTALQTDANGRLHGTERIHVVDASALPSIPATTITFSVSTPLGVCNRTWYRPDGILSVLMLSCFSELVCVQFSV